MASLSFVFRTLRKFACLQGRRRVLLEAALWLALIRIAQLIIPFRRLIHYLGVVTPPALGELGRNAQSPLPEHIAVAEEIAWAVSRAALHAPFQAMCLHQAMAAKAMLRRRGIAGALYFGAARDAAGLMEAHAWLLAAGVEVTGYPVPSNFVTIACFV
jgi:hypothetical protein